MTAPTPKTVLVCGSRDWIDVNLMADELAELTPYYPVEVIHGGARGADTMADGLAKQFGFKVRVFPADWDTHGKRAGIIRNLQMLDEKPDLVLAFRVNGSRGTTHTIEAARKRGIPVRVVECP